MKLLKTIINFTLVLMLVSPCFATAAVSNVTLVSSSPATNAVINTMKPTFTFNLSGPVNSSGLNITTCATTSSICDNMIGNNRYSVSTQNQGKTIVVQQLQNLVWVGGAPGMPADRGLYATSLTGTDTSGVNFYVSINFAILKTAYENTKSNVSVMSSNPTDGQTIDTVTPTIQVNLSDSINSSSIKADLYNGSTSWAASMVNALGQLSVGSDNRSLTYKQTKPIPYFDGLAGNPVGKNKIIFTVSGTDSQGKSLNLNLSFYITKSGYENSKSPLQITSSDPANNSTVNTLSPTITLNLSNPISIQDLRCDIYAKHISWGTSIDSSYKGSVNITNNGRTLTYQQIKPLPYFGNVPGEIPGQSSYALGVYGTDTTGKTVSLTLNFSVPKSVADAQKSNVKVISSKPADGSDINTLLPQFNVTLSEAVQVSTVKGSIVATNISGLINQKGSLFVDQTGKIVTYQQNDPLLAGQSYQLNLSGKDQSSKDFNLAVNFKTSNDALELNPDGTVSEKGAVDVLSSYPGPGATVATLAPRIKVKLSKPISSARVYLIDKETHKTSELTDAKIKNYTDNSVINASVEGKNLEANTQYTLLIKGQDSGHEMFLTSLEFNTAKKVNWFTSVWEQLRSMF